MRIIMINMIDKRIEEVEFKIEKKEKEEGKGWGI